MVLAAQQGLESMDWNLVGLEMMNLNIVHIRTILNLSELSLWTAERHFDNRLFVCEVSQEMCLIVFSINEKCSMGNG